MTNFLSIPRVIGRSVLRRIRSLSAKEVPAQYTMGDIANVVRNSIYASVGSERNIKVNVETTGYTGSRVSY